MQKQININELMKSLELPMSLLTFTKQSYQQGLAGVEPFKEIVKKQRKVLAKKYHPDNGGDDVKMKEVNNAADLLLMIEVKPIRKPQIFYPGRVFHTNPHHDGGATVSYTWTLYAWTG